MTRTIKDDVGCLYMEEMFPKLVVNYLYVAANNTHDYNFELKLMTCVSELTT